MDGDLSSQQPDFGVIADSLGTLSGQARRCGNLPAMDNGRSVVEAIDSLGASLRREMQTFREEMQVFRQETQGNFSRLDLRFKAMEPNNLARLENSTALHGDDSLIPLLSVNTGQVIDDFPQTIRELLTATSVEVNRILAELGMPLRGSLPEQRRRLLLTTGVTTLAV